MNRYYIITVLLMVITAGCVTPPITETAPKDEYRPTVPECRLVYQEEPYIEEVCANVSYTEEECDMKELDYTVGQIIKTDLCIQDGECVGKNLYDCFGRCSAAMKRCRMNITNNDEKHGGVWVVGATFGYEGAAFVKNPQDKEIMPGETHIFDFEQMYDLGTPPTVATCTVTVLYPAVVRDCVDVTKTRVDCINVTKTRVTQVEVCD